MTADTILYLYCGFLLLQVAVDLLLNLLNYRHIQRNAQSVPQEFSELIDIESYRSSVAYSLTKLKMASVHGLYSSILVLVFILAGWFGYIDARIELLDIGIFAQGLIFVIGVSFIFQLADIPFGLYSQFVVEERFGFNNMTFALWVKDFIKGTLLSLVIGIPILLALFWFMEAAGSYWWVYGFGFLISVQILLLYVYPVWVSPLFNKFEPLEGGELRDAIENVAADTSFSLAEIYTMDGSKRSGHGNAYFTGFGRNKRIVLFDTLIELLDVREIVAVLAHEIGHQKLHHIIKMLFISAIIGFFSFWLLGRCFQYPPFFQAFGLERVSHHGALVLFMFASAPFSHFLSPIVAIWSRSHEYQADNFARDVMGGGKELGHALIKLSRKSLSNLTPHPWFSFFHYSHPVLLERLRALDYAAVRE